MKAWIGLGTNVGEGPVQLRQALKLLNRDPSIEVLRSSVFFRTEPWGFTRQAGFTNAVAELSVQIEPLQLLELLKKIEEKMGRKPGSRRWGPRCIDLDILLFDERILFLPELTVPHPRMHRRAFVLIPLYDLEPDLVIPARGKLQALIERLDDKGVSRLTDENPAYN